MFERKAGLAALAARLLRLVVPAVKLVLGTLATSAPQRLTLRLLLIRLLLIPPSAPRLRLAILLPVLAHPHLLQQQPVVPPLLASTRLHLLPRLRHSLRRLSLNQLHLRRLET